jgi:hypothetical protein
MFWLIGPHPTAAPARTTAVRRLPAAVNTCTMQLARALAAGFPAGGLLRERWTWRAPSRHRLARIAAQRLAGDQSADPRPCAVDREHVGRF